LNVWYLDKNTSQLEFPINYVEVQQKLLDSLLVGNNTGALNLVYNLITTDVTKEYLLTQVILPTINIIDDLYNRGRISESERQAFQTFAMDLIALVGLVPNTSPRTLRARSLCIAGSESSVHFAKIASAVMNLSGWNAVFMGNVETKIDPFFDIDLQRFILKFYGKSKGLVVILIFSFSEGPLRFLCNAVKSLKSRFSGDLRLILFTKEELGGTAQTLGADWVTWDIFQLHKWLESEYKKSYG
jgi:hypothetical protein